MINWNLRDDYLSLLELAPFQVALHHTLIEFLSEFVKEIGAAVIFAMLHIHIYVVAVLYLHPEDFRESICQLLNTDFSIVDTITGVESVKEFYQVCCFARPTEIAGHFLRSREQPLQPHSQQF